MKLVKHDTIRERGKYILRTAWKNQMRQPRTLVMQEQAADDFDLKNSIEFEDKGHLGKFIEGMGEIAWAYGWRPKGLENVLVQVVRNYKVPGE